jgi:UDPglucose 6-dehydrogenase
MVADRLSDRVLFDGRNIYDPESMRAAGLEYLAIGRP